jgi:hypothetical protein
MGATCGHARPQAFLSGGESVKANDSESTSRNLPAKLLAQRLGSVGCAVALVIVVVFGLVRITAQESFPLPAIDPPGAKSAAPGTRTAPSQSGTAALDAHAPEVSKQCAEILRLATDLKAAVDQTSAGTLSVTVVRKAGEIEQLAHKVRNANAKY